MAVFDLILFALVFFVVLYVPWGRVGNKITEKVNKFLDKV